MTTPLAELDALNSAPSPNSEPTSDLAALDLLNEGARVAGDDRLNLVSEDGREFANVAADEAGLALSQGWRVASDSDFQRNQNRQFNESAVGLAATAGENLAQGATLGLYGLGMGLADEGYRERMDQRAEDNPYTAGTFQVAGAVLPAVLSGGAGVAGSIARATPAGIVEGIGAAAGRNVAGRIAGESAARIAGVAAAGAVEGALGNTVATIAAEFPHIAQDPQGAAEHILASASEGLLLGGVMGGALGGLSEGLGSLSRSLEGRALRQAEEAARRAADAPKVDEGNFGQVVINLEAKPLDSGSILAQRAANDTRAQVYRDIDAVKAAEGGLEDAIQDGIGVIETEANKLYDVLDDADTDAGISEKIKEVARRQGGNIRTLDVTDPLAKIESRLDAAVERFGEAALADGGGLAAIKRVKAQGEHALKRINEYVDPATGDILPGKAGEVFIELDQYKRVMQRLAKNSRAPIVREILRDESEVFRQFLQSEEAFGSLGAMQREVNGPWADRFLKEGDSRVQDMTLAESGDRARDLYETKTRANGQSIGAILNNLGKREFEGKVQAYRQMIRAQAKDAATRAGVWGTPELKKKAVEAVRSAAKIEEVLDSLTQKHLDAIAGRKLLQRSPGSELLSNVASSIVPFSGIAIQGVANLKRQAMRAVADTAGQTQIKVLNAASKLVRGAKKGTDSAARGIPRVAVATQRALDKEIRAAQELQDPQSPAYQTLLREAADMDTASPGLGSAYVQAAQNRAAFIASKLPVPPSDAIFGPPAKLDPATERKMKRYVGAAYAPTAALDRIASGKGTFEDVEAVKTLYPRLYDNFVQKTAELLGQMKTPPNLETRLRIAYATGLQVDPSVKNVAQYQQLAQAGGAAADQEQATQQQQAQGGPQPIVMGGRSADQVYAAPMDRVLNRM